MFKNSDNTSKELSNLIINKTTYFQMINLMITYYMANDHGLSRKEAYEKAIVEWSDKENKKNIIESIFNLGPI